MDYYYKYLKYKTKYQKLQDYKKDIDSLYKYFISSNIFELNDNYIIVQEMFKNNNTNQISMISDDSNKFINLSNVPNQLSSPSDDSNQLSSSSDDSNISQKRRRISTSSSKYKDFSLLTTPSILSYITPTKRSELQKDLDADTNKINEINNLIDENDSTYINVENHGKLIEIWLADNMKCPCCKQKTLKRYTKDNFPIIDLVCININHNIDDGVKFFQVKSSHLNSTSINGQPYFSFQDKTIMTGSKNWGKLVHEIKGSDNYNKKKILIGYICILFTESSDQKYIYINQINSFVVLPYVYLDDDEPYYEYTDFNYHPQIRFNNNMNFIGNFNGHNLMLKHTNEYDNYTFIETNRIPINYDNKWISVKNPLDFD